MHERIHFHSFTFLGKEIMRRWTNVRDAFAKFCKKQKEETKSGAGASKHKKYVSNICIVTS